MDEMRPLERSSRDIWSHGGGPQLRELLASALATLLFVEPTPRPAYFSSPWISDFVLLKNEYGQFGALFPDIADRVDFTLREYLIRLSRRVPTRIITTRNVHSEGFLATLGEPSAEGVEWRFADSDYHEKGILAPSLYIEGSMNITYSGVYINGEKITYHAAGSREGAGKVAAAYLEFDRRWENLG